MRRMNLLLLIGPLLAVAAASGSQAQSLLQGPAPATARSTAARSSQPIYCTWTANIASGICETDLRSDYQAALARCLNINDAGERTTCLADADGAKDDGRTLCKQQLAARRALCARLGEARYDPQPDPANFTNDFHNQGVVNRYIPLTIGNQWQYAGGDEMTTVEVLDATKSIAGLTCIVLHDRVVADGLVEDTEDWLAQELGGDVWYCGEATAEFALLAEDHPPRPEIFSIDGTFKAGRDGDKPGFWFRGAPRVGEVYRQEFSLNNAEDVAEVLATNYSYGANPVLDSHVPQALATLLCAGDCIVTKEWTPREPTAIERKYYAPGIGQFLTVKLVDGSVRQLVSCNFNSRCATLPPP